MCSTLEEKRSWYRICYILGLAGRTWSEGTLIHTIMSYMDIIHQYLALHLPALKKLLLEMSKCELEPKTYLSVDIK